MGKIHADFDDRRRFERAVLPQLCVRIAGRVYHSVEWSFGGLVVRDEFGHLPAAALVSIDGLVGENDYMNAQPPEEVDIRARVVRVMADDGLVALSCLKVDDLAYRLLCAVRNGDVIQVADQV